MGSFVKALGVLAALAALAGVGLVFSQRQDAGGSGDRSVRYQFVDDAGRVQIVDSLDAVPADRREGVGRIEFDAPAGAKQAQPDGGGFSIRSLFAGGEKAGGARDAKLVVYTTQRCGFSKRLLAELDARGVAYENRDIDRDPVAKAELIEISGREGVPFSVYGDQTWRGYNPRRARELESAVEGSWFF